MRDVLFLSDLDHCLFQSKRVDTQGTHPMTIKGDGTPHCFATEAQKTLMAMLAPRSVWIAVTARTVDQMSRTIGWQPEHDHQLALVNHGATLLYRPDGKSAWEEVSAWGQLYIEQAQANQKQLEADVALLIDKLHHFELPTGSRLVVSVNELKPGTPFYFNIQLKDAGKHGNERTMRQIRDSVAMLEICTDMGLNYLHHLNDTTIGFWPSYIGKKAAVSRLVEALSNGIGDERIDLARAQIPKVALTLTAGDSQSDVPFMLEGDFMMTPTNSPIARSAKKHSASDLNPFS